MPEYLPQYFYDPKDFRADTRHLTPAQRDAYREILDEIWIKFQAKGCSIPDEPRILAQLLGLSEPEWIELREIFVESPWAVLKADRGRLYSKRLREEYALALDRHSRAHKGSTARWRTRKQQGADLAANLYAGEPAPPASPTEPEEPKTRASAPPIDPRIGEAIEQYRLLGSERKIPGLTDKAAARLRPKIAKATDELEAECDGFTWTECFRRARTQPFVFEIRSFDFEWLLKREKDGTRLNAKKVWNDNFADFNDRTDRRSTSRDARGGAGAGGNLNDAPSSSSGGSGFIDFEARARAKRDGVA